MTKFYGTNDGDMIVGWGGDDKIFGYGGNDVLLGMDGQDTLIGGAGADFLDGGSGNFDTASYSGSPAGVTVNLKTGQGSGGDAEGDTLMNIEQLVGSEYDDVLVGDDGNNYHLAGGGGNDTLFGGEGDDWLYGFSDHDTLLGGEGNDRLYGGESKDTLKGGGGSDYLYGEGGNDQLYGDGGNDHLYGDDGNDYLEGGDGSDYLAGGEGADELIGGVGRGDVFGFETWKVYLDEYDVVEFHTDSKASDPDHIVDFEGIVGLYDFDRINMPTAGTATNYIETALGYNAGYLEAKTWADAWLDSGLGQTPVPASDNGFTYAFVTDGVNGYLFGDLFGEPFDGYATTGIVLEGLTSLDDFDYWYII